MSPLGLPRLSSDPVLFLPLWLGTLRDHSGFGNHPTVNNLHWTQRGNIDSVVSAAGIGNFIVPDSASMRLLDLSFFYAAPAGLSQVATQRVIGRDGISDWQHRLAAGTIQLYAGGVLSQIVVAVDGSTSCGGSLSAGSKPDFYLDGAHAGQGNVAITPTASSSTLIIGSGFVPPLFDLSMVVVCNGELTSDDFAQLYAYSQARTTPRKQWPGAGLRYSGRETNLLVDGDMEEADLSAWTTQGDVTKTEIGAEYGRALELNYTGAPQCYAGQVQLDVGQQVRVTCRAWSDGSGVPQIGTSAVIHYTGPANNFWYDVDTYFIPTSTTFRLWNTSVVGRVKFDNIKVWTCPPGYTPQTGDPLYLDNIQSARVTLVDETSGLLSNTNYFIQSGTWRLSEDATTGERYIKCVVAGIISRRNLLAYGTWEFDVYKAADAADIYISIIASGRGAADSAGQDGYSLQIDVSERVSLRESVAGSVTTRFFSATGYVALNTKYKIRVTRREDGQFTVYIVGGSFSVWTLVIAEGGANPVTDNTTLTSLYEVHDLNAGDRIYLDRQFSGEIAPV